VKRICYGCNKELTLEEAAGGQKAVEQVENSSIEFEGWVHCQGEPGEFVQENDEELKELLAKMGVPFYDEVIHVCRKCVKQQVLLEAKDSPDYADELSLEQVLDFVSLVDVPEEE